MTGVQKTFLAKLKARVEGNAPEKDIADYIMKVSRNPKDLWDCLVAFMTVSAKYGIEKKSMFVYWGVASLVLHRCEPYLVLEFEYRSRPEADTEWSKRYAALPAYAVEEAKKSIAEKKAKATSLDFRRLERLKEADADVEAAKKAKPPPDRRKLSKEARAFVKAFHTFMASRKDAAKKVFDRHLESLRGAQLEACLYAYIEESERYAPNDEQSLYTFYALSSEAMHRCSGFLALKFQDWIQPATKATYAKLYANLEDWQKTELAKDFDYANKHTRILDELRYAYYKANGKDPDDRALRDFEAVQDDAVRREVSGTLADYDRYCEKNDLRGFNSSWDDFVKLADQKDRLKVAMVAKWCRDWLAGDKVMRDELYWSALGVLFNRLLLDRPEEYARGFNDDEKAYFISFGRAKHPYLDDFLRRMRFHWTKRDDKAFRDLSKVHAVLILYGNRRNMRLATMEETEIVFGNVERVRDEGPSPRDILSVPVTQREGLLKDHDPHVSLGETFGDIGIVWFDSFDTAYVECRGLEKVLFVMHETDYGHQLGDLTNARFYDKVYEDTKGLLELIPVFFQVLTFLPDLVSGGLTGLAKSIALQYIITEGTEAVLGEGEASQWVASAISMGTGHLTQTESMATRNITAELRAAEALEHGSLSAHGFTLHGEHANVSGSALGEKSLVLGGAGEVATLEITPIVTHEKVSALHAGGADVPAGSQRLANIREVEGVQYELVAAERGTGGRAVDVVETAQKEPPKQSKSKAPKKGQDKGGDRGTTARGTASKGKRQAPTVDLWATQDFTRSGIRYRFVGTLDDFTAVQSFVATRYQVYQIRNASNQVVYVGIVGGKTLPKNALDRLRQHLYTKFGEFVGDADTIHIVGADLDERVARALEDSLIDDYNPLWNNRARDPEAYVKKYGQKPSDAEVRLANNTHHAFKIEIRQ